MSFGFFFYVSCNNIHTHEVIIHLFIESNNTFFFPLVDTRYMVSKTTMVVINFIIIIMMKEENEEHENVLGSLKKEQKIAKEKVVERFFIVLKFNEIC